MKKSILILMRHAKSGWPENVRSDFDRPLAKRGEEDAPYMGRWLRKNGLVPDKVISSPAQRAHATAVLVAEKLRIPRKRIILEERIYDAGLRQLLDVVAAHGADTDALLLIGHNPGLEELLTHLAREPPPRNDRGRLMTTAAVAVLEFKGDISIKPRCSRLQQLVRPRDLQPARLEDSN